MNAIFFGLKRAFHGTLRVTRSALNACGLTAARFDLLYALHERSSSREGAWQSALRRELGVSRTTVSRMLRSLEALGVVTRKRDPRDRRQRVVTFTADGRRRIKAGIFRFIRTGCAQLAVDTALGGERWHSADGVCFEAMQALDGQLRGIRHTYRDSATLYYPWHPDD